MLFDESQNIFLSRSRCYLVFHCIRSTLRDAERATADVTSAISWFLLSDVLPVFDFTLPIYPLEGTGLLGTRTRSESAAGRPHERLSLHLYLSKAGPSGKDVASVREAYATVRTRRDGREV
jgi:hypothetical protein